MLAHLTTQLVRATRPIIPPSRVLLFGSRARGTARIDSDLDVLLVVAPALTRPWSPRDNVRLAATLRQAIQVPLLDLQVRTIDQVAEAAGVPVCPEHSATAHGMLLWTAAWTRAPSPRRSPAAVRGDNALDWLRYAEGARDALCAGTTAPNAARHYERSVRASLVAFAVATVSSVPDHKQPLAPLLTSLRPEFAGVRDEQHHAAVPDARAEVATAVARVARVAVRELLQSPHN